MRIKSFPGCLVKAYRLIVGLKGGEELFFSPLAKLGRREKEPLSVSVQSHRVFEFLSPREQFYRQY